MAFWGHLLQDDDDYSSSTSLLGQKKPGYHAPVALLNDIPQSTEQVTFFFFFKLKPEFIQLKKTERLNSNGKSHILGIELLQCSEES